MQKQSEKVLGQIRILYLALLTVYALLREAIPAQNLVRSPVLIYGLFAVGVILIALEFCKKKSVPGGTDMLFMLMFIGFSLVTVLINFEYEFVSNLKAIGWMLLFFLLLFPSGKAKREGERTAVFSAAVSTASLLALFSVPMYLFHVDYSYRNESIFGVDSSQGFSGEFARLWGVFGDPNTAAVYMSVALLMAGMLFAGCRKKMIRVLLVLEAVPMVLFIALSGSRTVFLTLGITCGWLVFYGVVSLKKEHRKRIFAGISGALLSLILCFSLVSAVRFGLPYLKRGVVLGCETETVLRIHDFYQQIYSFGQVKVEENFRPGVDDWDNVLTSLNRKDWQEKGDVSNGRFEIWMDSIKLFSASPLVGTSPRGAPAFAQIHQPQNLIAKYGVACHNFLLEILVGCGVLGFVIAAAMLLRFAVRIIKIALTQQFRWDTLFFSGIVLSLICSSMFLSDLFFVFTFGGLAFWFSLGALSDEPETVRKIQDPCELKRILIYGPKDPVGGVERIVFEYVRTILSGHPDVSFDFLQYGSEFSMEGKLSDLGCRVLYLPSRKHYFAYKKALRDVFKKTQYAAVWGNFSGLTNIDLLVYAKRYGVPLRIAHSHGSRLYWGSRVMKYAVHILHYFNKWFRLEEFATDYFACSHLAGEFMFPKAIHSQIVKIPNAVDTKLFYPSKEQSALVRKEFDIPADAVVIGHVARMCWVKNQVFLLQAVAEAVKKNPAVRLLLVGDGELREQLEQDICRLQLESHVILTGTRNDVPSLLRCMDVFVLTSFSEGLSVSAVEAQASGLPCVVPTSVSSETDITGCVQFLPLAESSEIWANVILSAAERKCEDVTDKLISSGYELESASEALYRRLLG